MSFEASDRLICASFRRSLSNRCAFSQERVIQGALEARVMRAWLQRRNASREGQATILRLDALADVIRARNVAQHASLFGAAARRIEATFGLTPRERHDAVRIPADRLVVLA